MTRILREYLTEPTCLYNKGLISFVGKEYIVSLGFYGKAKKIKKPKIPRGENGGCGRDTLKQVVLPIK